MLKKIKFNRELISKWYERKDIYYLISKSVRYKYLSFMRYNDDGSTNDPRRFMYMIPDRKESYDWMIRYAKIGSKLVSFYRDTDNWKDNRPHFSNVREKYQIQRSLFLNNKEYRKYQMNPDFVIDLDGSDPYQVWEIARDILDLYDLFNVEYAFWFSGSKGWQIVVSGYQALKRTFFFVGLEEYSIHYALAFNIKEYLKLNSSKEKADLIEKCFDMSAYYDLRYIKQPYSLDGRNMCPIIPLTRKEFEDFKTYEGKEYNPYTDINYWLDKPSFVKRGWVSHNYGNMDKLDAFLDKQLAKV